MCSRVIFVLVCIFSISGCEPSAEEIEERKQRRIANEARDQALFEADGFTVSERALFMVLQKKQNKNSPETAAFLDLLGRKTRHEMTASTKPVGSDWIAKLSKYTADCADVFERNPRSADESESCRKAIDQMSENRSELFGGAMTIYGQFKNDLGNRNKFAQDVWPDLVKTWESLERMESADVNGDVARFVAEARKIVKAGEGLAQTKDRQVIADIQENLNRLGYNAGTPDGIAGSKTRDAIKKLQSSRGEVVDGIASEDLLRILKLL